MSEEKNESLMRVKVDSGGVDLSVGTQLPRVIAQILPQRFRLKRIMDQTIASKLIRKLEANEEFTEAEIEFAEEVFSEQAMKLIRLHSVGRRAYELYSETPLTRLLASGSSEDQQEDVPKPETSQDWINKFREDASLVDDEVVQELYARILAEESATPRSFSLRTLGVLRYLDPKAAQAFSRILPIVIDGNAVPRLVGEDSNHPLPLSGLFHSDMVLLNDAGLVSSSIATSLQVRGTADQNGYLHLNGFRQVLRLSPIEGRMHLDLNVHLLTTAGTELVRVAEAKPHSEIYEKLITWIRPAGLKTKIALSVAELQSSHWDGNFKDKELVWRSLD